MEKGMFVITGISQKHRIKGGFRGKSQSSWRETDLVTKESV